MDRITGTNAVDLGGGKLGFRDRNLSGGITGTAVIARWLNGVQEELLRVIEQAGVTPDDENNTQLHEALGKLFGGRGALFALASAQTIPNATETAVSWPAATYDDVGFWSGGAPTRITIPAGVTRVRFTAQAGFNTSATGGRSMRIVKNGSVEGGGLPSALIAAQSGVVPTPVGMTGGIVACTAGDYFQFRVQHDHGFDLNVNAGITWLHVEALR